MRCHVRGQMVLPRERRSGKITEIKRVRPAWNDVCIVKRAFYSLDRQRAEAPVWERSKCGLSGAENYNRSHTRLKDSAAARRG